MSSSFSTRRALTALAASLPCISMFTRPEPESLTGRQVHVVEPQELLAVEALQPAQHPIPDTSRSDSTHDLVLEVKGVTSDIGDRPIVVDDLLVRWGVVADEVEDGHDDVLGDGDDVTPGHLKPASKKEEHSSQRRTSATVILWLFASFRSMWSEPEMRCKVISNRSKMRSASLTYASGDAELELWRLLDEVRSEIARMERGSDENLRLLHVDELHPNRRSRSKERLTSGRCFWKSLPGPSLSSVTTNLDRVSLMSTVIIEQRTHDPPA